MKRRSNSMSLGAGRVGGGASAKCGAASAVVIAGMSGARAGAQETAVGQVVGSGLGSWRETVRGWRPTDAYEWTGLAGLAIAVALIVAAPYFVRSWRRFFGLAGCVLLAGVGGYVL